MNGWELFLGIAIGNMLGTWAAQRHIRSLQRDFDEAIRLGHKTGRLNGQLLECLTRRNKQICQAREN